ncbi:probably inactive receptor-like protein kinase At2g46850 [Rutidosis leptorrhynchoides]|uniref:probably inactive receptor-like protein kinase At2g46850 n=1 Tax=Rutidosis leptorrhynchoides TaxID=125765 RepID=UPI003A99F762
MVHIGASFLMFFNNIVMFIFFILLVVPQVASHGCPQQKCGTFDSIPYPFRLDNGSNCGELLSDAFHLSCFNETSLFIKIGSYRYQVLHFFLDGGGVLVDFPNDTVCYSSSCRTYYDLKSFRFQANDYFGIAKDNLVGLYGCGDSSLCRSDCGGCHDANSTTTFTSNGCCYLLSEDRGGVWRVGDGFDVFEEFGCKGFSSWVGSGLGSNNGEIKRGVKLEWAIPSELIKGTCALNAQSVNASSVISGMRCKCVDGFIGDGFAKGSGCLKYCLKGGVEVYGKACYPKGHGRGKLMLAAGILALSLSIATLIGLFCLLKRQTKLRTADLDQTRTQSSVSFHKGRRTRLFTHTELEQATNGFSNDQKLVNIGDESTIYAGVLTDGLQVAVHKVRCTTETDLIQVLSQVKILSEVTHTNMARILGCSIDSGYTPLVVYENPGNGTLEQHLRQAGTEGKMGIDWQKRLTITVQLSSVLAYLQTEIFPPVFHHGLESGCVLLDHDMSVKLVGFELLDHGSDRCGSNGPFSNKNDVYGLGVVLLEILAGGKSVELATVALRKIRNGKLEEVVDPMLYYHEQPAYRKEQIGIVADVATRCLLFGGGDGRFGGGDGRLGMNDVARELVHVTKESIDHVGSRRGPAGLEETFSNSSLLQMISLSPDSIYVP